MARRPFLDPNLARAPFENARPVMRLTLALWLLAAGVGGTTWWLTSTARAEAARRRAELEAVTAETTKLRDSAARLKATLESAGLEARNERTSFLNERIAERAFSWNAFFDKLGEVLPRGVRIVSLTPQGFQVESPKAGKRARRSTSAIAVKISGEAETADAMLELVDRLYAHPSFRDPQLSRDTESHQHVTFALTVAYVPAGAPGISGDAAAPALADGTRPAGDRAGDAVAPPATAGLGSAGVAPASGATAKAPAPLDPGGPAPAAASRAARPAGTGFERGRTTSAWAGGADPSAEDGGSGGAEAKLDPANGGRPRGSTGEVAVPRGAMLPAPLKPFASPPSGVR
jgi:hypothetical protein